MKSRLPLLLSGCLVLVPAAPASAQEPSRPATRPPVAAPRDPEPKSRDIALADIFDQYARLTGKRIVTDNTVSMTAPCTLPDLENSGAPQRINLIERTLFLSNYALIDADADTVAVLGPGKNPRSVGLPLYTKPEEIPSGERVFSYLCRLEHRDAFEVANFLQQFIPPSSITNFNADAKGRTVIITAPTSIVRTVLRVVATLDADHGGAAGR